MDRTIALWNYVCGAPIAPEVESAADSLVTHAMRRVATFHGAVMSGGVVDTVEYMSPDQILDLTFSLETLGLTDLATGLTDLLRKRPPLDDEAASETFEEATDTLYASIAPDDVTLINLMRPTVERYTTSD